MADDDAIDITGRIDIALAEAQSIVDTAVRGEHTPSILATLAAGMELVRMAAYSAEEYGAANREELIMWAFGILRDDGDITISLDMWMRMSSDTSQYGDN